MTLSVHDVCERTGVGEHTVLGWIKRGELRAINVGRRPGGKRPTWRITTEALAEFERLRTATPPLPRARRKNTISVGVIEFYK